MLDLDKLSDEDLLEKRICDLGLKMDAPDLLGAIAELYKNIEAKKLLFKPVCYLADEWFVLEGHTSIGVPFYLSHPRLKKLEQKMMLEVEGGDYESCLKLLRHEAGHAFFYAYELGKNKIIRKTFGPSPAEPPSTYKPKPYSKNYVRHLDNFYAQAEPDEDFAETFAVWIDPNNNWREDYKNWGALKKLECIDQVFSELENQKVPNITRTKSCAVEKLKIRLSNHYAKRHKDYAHDYPDYFDGDLLSIFASAETLLKNENEKTVPASVFLKSYNRMIIATVVAWTGERKYIVTNLIKKIVVRCSALGLVIKKSEEQTLIDLCSFLTTVTLHYLYTGKFKPKV